MSEQSGATEKHSRGPLINQLPCEILSSIFVLVHSDARSSCGGTGARNCLAFVCRLWHEVALSTPELWSYVSLSSPIERLTTRLALSKQAPLDMIIDTNWSSFGAETIELSLDLLKEHWLHLRTLQVTLLDPYCMRETLDTLNHAARVYPHCALEEIQIDFRVLEAHPQFSHHLGKNGVSYLFLPNSYRLRRVELRGLNPYPMFLSPTDTPSGLRELVLESATSRFLGEVLPAFLSLTPNLTSLSIRKHAQAFFEETVPDVHDISAMSRISLPKLESLKLTDVLCGLVNRILGEIDVPNLRSFSFHTFEYGSWEINWETIQRCRELRRLSFKDVSFVRAAGILSWMKTLDNLEQIEVYSHDQSSQPSFASEMLEMLTNSTCCAKLKSLDVHFRDDLYLLNSLREFQEARPSVSLGDAFLSTVNPVIHGH